MPFTLVEIVVPDYKPLAKRVWDCIGAKEGDTYHDVDTKFQAKLQALSLPSEVEAKVFSAWMKFTDHDRPSRISRLDSREMGLLISVFERITAS